MVRMFIAGGYVMWMITLIGVAYLIASVRFAMRGEPRLLAVVRALTWALVFTILSGIASDLSATMSHVVRSTASAEERSSMLIEGIGESCTPATLGFTVLSIGWIVVAVGVRRSKPES